jgi:hypothetical protein
MYDERGVLPPEGVARWQRLWQEYVEGAALHGTQVHEAVLICHMGWGIAMHAGDHEMAMRRLQRWFEHPGLASADSVDLAEMRRAIGCTHLESGDITAAIASFKSLLSSPPHGESPHLIRCTVRNTLIAFSEGPDEQSIAPDDLAAFARDLVSWFSGGARLAATIPLGNASYGEIRNALERAVGRRARRQTRPGAGPAEGAR